MNKIKTANLLQTDGTYVKNVPIGADAKNVDMTNGTNLQDVIGSINPSSEGSIAQQLEDIKRRLASLGV